MRYDYNFDFGMILSRVSIHLFVIWINFFRPSFIGNWMRIHNIEIKGNNAYQFLTAHIRYCYRFRCTNLIQILTSLDIRTSSSSHLMFVDLICYQTVLFQSIVYPDNFKVKRNKKSRLTRQNVNNKKLSSI